MCVCVDYGFNDVNTNKYILKIMWFCYICEFCAYEIKNRDWKQNIKIQMVGTAR